ncbi:MAG TPA: hypothetical protein PLD84_02125, partial [Chitinophagales bacterium]|nr:hypothetical protein [Chitinophagales bacterium]
MKTQRTTYLFVFLLFISDKISAQPLGVQWDHAYGTNVYDECRSTAPSADGGYLLGGHTSGDI